MDRVIEYPQKMGLLHIYYDTEFDGITCTGITIRQSYAAYNGQLLLTGKIHLVVILLSCSFLYE